jgi:hypothetical protein
MNQRVKYQDMLALVAMNGGIIHGSGSDSSKNKKILTPEEIKEKEKAETAEKVKRKAHFQRIYKIHQTIQKIINDLLPNEQQNYKYKQPPPNAFSGYENWTLTTEYKKNETVEFVHETWANDLVNNDLDEMVTSHLYIKEQSQIMLEKSIVDLTLKEIDKITIFPFLRGTPGATAPEVLTNTINRVLLGFLPIHRIFRGFDKWTHVIDHVFQAEKYIISLKSTSFAGFCERNTIIEYKNSDYENVHLTIRSKREPTPISLDSLKVKIRLYLDTQQWSFQSRYEAQTERIALMLKTHASV